MSGVLFLISATDWACPRYCTLSGWDECPSGGTLFRISDKILDVPSYFSFYKFALRMETDPISFHPWQYVYISKSTGKNDSRAGLVGFLRFPERWAVQIGGGVRWYHQARVRWQTGRNISYFASGYSSLPCRDVTCPPWVGAAWLRWVLWYTANSNDHGEKEGADKANFDELVEKTCCGVG